MEAWQIAGSLAEWFTGIAAAVALIFAAKAARSASATNRAQQAALEIQRQQQENIREDSYRAQGLGVAFWQDASRFYVLNTSRLPIYSVSFWLLIPGDLRLFRNSEERIVLPSQSAPVELAMDLATGYSDPDLTIMIFTDAAGREWVRRQSGELLPAAEVITAEFTEKRRQLWLQTSGLDRYIK